MGFIANRTSIMHSDSVLNPEHSELGKKSHYDSTYNPEKLFPISRKKNRDALGINTEKLPFYGFDSWNHYEVSWLNQRGKPVVGVAEIIFGCETENIIESKSMKLYLNSYKNKKMSDVSSIEETIKNDLDQRVNGPAVNVRITPLQTMKEIQLASHLDGINLDELDVDCSIYHNEPAFLATENEWAEETLCSDLLRSNCLVTNQPDWVSVQIVYKGQKINREGLLRYIVSFRNDNEFHEQCVEKIFVQIMERCHPQELTVYGLSTRRGGLSINSLRSTQPVELTKMQNIRLYRQ
jgi:7-cyano-7-deazaguanine reductase